MLDTLDRELVGLGPVKRRIRDSCVTGTRNLVAGLRAENNTFSSETYRYNSGTPSAPTRIRR